MTTVATQYVSVSSDVRSIHSSFIPGTKPWTFVSCTCKVKRVHNYLFVYHTEESIIKGHASDQKRICLGRVSTNERLTVVLYEFHRFFCMCMCMCMCYTVSKSQKCVFPRVEEGSFIVGEGGRFCCF